MKLLFFAPLLLVVTAACGLDYGPDVDVAELRDGEDSPTTTASDEDEVLKGMDSNVEISYPSCGEPGDCEGTCMNVFYQTPTGSPIPATHYEQCTTECKLGDASPCASSPNYSATCAPYGGGGVCAIDCSISACPPGMQCIAIAKKTVEVCAWPVEP